MDALELVGNTPLIELKRVVPDRRKVRILAKAEYFNASGSVKDRAARAMILDGIRSGKLSGAKTIVDATSGNTGIAYAMIGAVLGIAVELYLPANVTEERKLTMRSYGAKLVETDALEGIDGAYKACRRAVNKDPLKYFYPDQYVNEANWKAHYEGTAEEIWAQTEGKLTHFLAGTGTSGTFMGCARKLKEKNKKIKCYNVTPDSPFHGIEGIKHRMMVLKDGFFDESISDGQPAVSTEEAYHMSRRLAREEGLFVGISSGANVAAAVRLAEKLPEGSMIVTILCDGGSRYVTGELWRVEDNGGWGI
ncbi:MAG: cysteine synthase family protein [Lachnospiraceae bacterium]|nr:cysteine synthase family protein [Lachnospiraceae bacterium]